jgi:hypothetical protein
MRNIGMAMTGLIALYSMAACSGPSGSNCEVVAGGDTRLQITNATGTGLTVDFDGFAFVALMRPGACEIYGLPTLTANLLLNRCTFTADNECQRTSQIVSRSIPLTRDETTAIVVDGGFF